MRATQLQRLWPGCASSAQGFTMVSVLFILVVLAALGAALASLSQRQQLGAAGELAAAKAHQAAFAGLEWGSYQVLRAGSQPACFSTRSIALANSLAGYTVTISCTRTPGGTATVIDGETTLAFYVVVATACNIPSAGACPNAATTQPAYAERQLTRTFGAAQ